MKQSELKLTDIPDKVIEHYNLRELATPDEYVYCEVTKGMYGLPQAGIIAHELLEKKISRTWILPEQDRTRTMETQDQTNLLLPRG